MGESRWRAATWTADGKLLSPLGDVMGAYAEVLERVGKVEG